jgi:DNA-binding XRE family transcriptional regulator
MVTPRKHHLQAPRPQPAAKSHIPSAAASANAVPFRPSMGHDERMLAIHKARVRSYARVARLDDYCDDDDVEHVPTLDVGGNYRIKDVQTLVRDPGRPPETLPPRFGARVSLLRIRLTLTIRALAKQAGLSARVLLRIEDGTTSPTLAMVFELALALGTTFAHLVDGLVS